MSPKCMCCENVHIVAQGPLRHTENSETQLGKDVRYKMLVRAVDKDTGEELAQLVSESFTVSIFWLWQPWSPKHCLPMSLPERQETLTVHGASKRGDGKTSCAVRLLHVMILVRRHLSHSIDRLGTTQKARSFMVTLLSSKAVLPPTHTTKQLCQIFECVVPSPVQQQQRMSLQVTTMRSKNSMKPAIPCLNDSVDKLEGLGGKTRRNLLDVRGCVRSIDARASVPHNAPNEIITGDIHDLTGLVQPIR